jgi:hypothetical protein
MQTRCNALAWNPMEAFNFCVANEDCNLYTYDMRKLKSAACVHKVSEALQRVCAAAALPYTVAVVLRWWVLVVAAAVLLMCCGWSAALQVDGW